MMHDSRVLEGVNVLKGPLDQGVRIRTTIATYASSHALHSPLSVERDYKDRQGIGAGRQACPTIIDPK